MDLPKVSVVIPNYNYEKYVARTINSVLAQTYPNLEIIVIDDGSKDNSLEVLKSFGDKIKVVRQKNQGVSRARNYGVELSSGEYIAFLDADDLWLSDKIEKQLAKFKTNESYGLVHCSMSLINLEDEIIGENSSGQEGWVFEEFLKFQSGVVIGAGSTALLKRSVFEEIGGFDLRLSTSADWDLSCRIARRYEIGFIREPLALYRIHNSNMHSNINLMRHDMLIGFEKAFAAEPERLRAIKGECYGNLHYALAGSYFHSKKYANFVRHLLKSVFYNPQKLIEFANFPTRWLRRRTALQTTVKSK